MSKTLHKQFSLQSPTADRSSRADEEYILDDSSKRLNRSLTLSGGTGDRQRPSSTLKHAREPDSPLRKFSRAKEAISKIFDALWGRLTEAQKFMGDVRKESEQLSALQKQTEGIKKILQRDHMKVAFFGRTSNGKSTVINSLLRERVLPAGIGHTTNCFCSVVGVEESEGYLIPPNSQERQNVKNVRQLAHSLSKEHLDPNSLVQIFWPKTKCPLLSGEVELVDSPGIDMNPDLDHWINTYCLDADVFVLVSNAESALMTAEKKFFHRVSQRLSKPNIFILNNRWDCSAQEEPDMMEQVMKQHLKADVNFLADELSVVDKDTARDRVFFVAAKEVLHLRTQIQPGVVEEEEGRGLADGWKDRLLAFERFEKLFKECISNSAISTKFEQHYKQGSEVIRDLEKLLSNELEELSQKCEQLQKEKREKMLQRQMFQEEGSRVKLDCEEMIKMTNDGAVESLRTAIRNISVPQLVGRYSDEFSAEKWPSCKQKLCEYMDNQLDEVLKQEITMSLSREYEEARSFITKRYQPLVGEDIKNRFYELITPPSLSFPFKCADLCEEFTPDSNFNFLRSLGISTGKMRYLLEPVLGSLYTRVSQLWSVVPMEYGVPIVLLGGMMMLPRVFSLRVWIISVGLYGGLYAGMWSLHDPDKEVKKQFAQHISSKVKDQTKAMCTGYGREFKNGLDLLHHALQGEVEEKEQATDRAITDLSGEVKHLHTLQTQAGELKNNTQFLRYDFEKFKDDHLVDRN